MNKYIATTNDAGRSILKFIEAHYKGVPKSKIEKAFRNKDIQLNKKRINNKSLIIKQNDEIIVYGIETNSQKIVYESIPKKFNVVYEDANILIVSKEQNVVTNDHPLSLDKQIWNYLKFKQVDSFVPSSVGRLDKVASGIIVYGKNYETIRELESQQSHFVKMYMFKSDFNQPGKVKFKIMHDEQRKREVCGNIGKWAITEFSMFKNEKIARILTGRKHQIRATLSKLGFPIYGDQKYGGKKDTRVFLHSSSIQFQGLYSSRLKYLNGMKIINKPKW